MTAIKPIENRRVVAVEAKSYPLNAVCAHPDCKEPAVDPHHAFARSAIGGDSWFVTITFETYEDALAVLGATPAVHEVPMQKKRGAPAEPVWVSDPIPHTTGLCRAHHEDAEEHRAWVKLIEGVWTWFDRYELYETGGPNSETQWAEIGPLNPQPGSRDGKPKRKRHQGEARRKRKVVSIRVPNDADEDGAALLDEAVESLENMIQGEEGEHRPIYYTIMSALDFTLLNADETDFE